MISVPRLLRWLALLAFCLVPAVGCNKSATTKAEDGPKADKSKFEQIKTGMTEDEVEKVLGKPDPKNVMDPEKMGVPTSPKGGKLVSKAWVEGDTMFTVVFKDGKVTETKSDKK